jgi:hypothetical protein
MRTIGVIVLLTLVSGPAGARCNNPRPRLVCAEYFQSKAVVIAKLDGVTPVKDDYDDLTGTYYSMTVEQSLRGQVARTFRVYEANDSGRAKFDWETGGSYVLFLRQRSQNGSWMIDSCGNSGPSNSKQSALDQIDMLDHNSNRARIQGAVGGVSFAFPLAGVQVEASGPGGVSTTETDAIGKFDMRVPPGKYQVRALSQGKTFVAEEFTYENPDNLVLESGGCAQVQFVESLKNNE